MILAIIVKTIIIVPALGWLIPLRMLTLKEKKQ